MRAWFQKFKRCFNEFIRDHTQLFVPVERAAVVLVVLVSVNLATKLRCALAG